MQGLQLATTVTYLAIKGPKTNDKGQIPTFSITFPSTPLQCNWLQLGKNFRRFAPGESVDVKIYLKLANSLVGLEFRLEC